MAEAGYHSTDLRIDVVSLRGSGLSRQVGRTLADAVAQALASQASTLSSHVDHLALRLPADVVAGGRVDRKRVAALVARQLGGGNNA